MSLELVKITRADLIGLVGLPMMLGIFAIIEFSDASVIYLSIMFCTLFTYLLMFNHYRGLATVATIATESFQFVVVGIEKHVPLTRHESLNHG